VAWAWPDSSSKIDRHDLFGSDGSLGGSSSGSGAVAPSAIYPSDIRLCLDGECTCT